MCQKTRVTAEAKDPASLHSPLMPAASAAPRFFGSPVRKLFTQVQPSRPHGICWPLFQTPPLSIYRWASHPFSVFSSPNKHCQSSQPSLRRQACSHILFLSWFRFLSNVLCVLLLPPGWPSSYFAVHFWSTDNLANHPVSCWAGRGRAGPVLEAMA